VTRTGAPHNFRSQAVRRACIGVRAQSVESTGAGGWYRTCKPRWEGARSWARLRGKEGPGCLVHGPKRSPMIAWRAGSLSSRAPASARQASTRDGSAAATAGRGPFAIVGGSRWATKPAKRGAPICRARRSYFRALGRRPWPRPPRRARAARPGGLRTGLSRAACAGGASMWRVSSGGSSSGTAS